MIRNGTLSIRLTRRRFEAVIVTCDSLGRPSIHRTITPMITVGERDWIEALLSLGIEPTRRGPVITMLDDGHIRTWGPVSEWAAMSAESFPPPHLAIEGGRYPRMFVVGDLPNGIVGDAKHFSYDPSSDTYIPEPDPWGDHPE